MGRNSAAASLPRASTASSLGKTRGSDLGRSHSFNRRKPSFSPSKRSCRSADNEEYIGSPTLLSRNGNQFCNRSSSPRQSQCSRPVSPKSVVSSPRTSPTRVSVLHTMPVPSQLAPPTLNSPHATPPPASPNPLRKDAAKLRWKRGKFLGAGAWGKVSLGLNQDSGKLMAVKTIEFCARDLNIAAKLTDLQHEIKVMKALKHDNIVQYLCTERVGSTINIFMEFVPGGSIAALLAEFGSLSEMTVTNYTRQILNALEYLHANNVIHRDVKGANVLLTVGGVCKLADFGTATFIVDVNKNVDKDKEEQEDLKGTPAWMAPEVINGSGGGMPCDVWSLGCTVMEMFTAGPPFGYITTVTFKLMKIIGSDAPLPPLPSYWGEDLVKFLVPCFNKLPEDRPSCTELIEHQYLDCGTSEEEEDEEGDYGSRVSVASTEKALYQGQRSEAAMSPAPNGIHSPLVVHHKNSLIIPHVAEVQHEHRDVYGNETTSQMSFGASTVFEHSLVETSYAPSPVNSRGKRKTRKYPFNDKASISSMSGTSFTTNKSRKSVGSKRIAASKPGTMENVGLNEEKREITKHLVGSCLSLINILPEMAETPHSDSISENDLVNGIAFSVNAADETMVSRIDSGVPGSAETTPPAPMLDIADDKPIPVIPFMKEESGLLTFVKGHKKKILILLLLIAIFVLTALLINTHL
eukprot:TRINITY_DN4730_c0_g1_i1.p1 TRINITY_DN4730_c0_g1~~TRINITY_DN4730_c0_g1_i1.p1  ORF type:complete len:692 (+),score=143.09 TRINITY_DN4730_c0_g1_i1:64-2139(+)